MSFAMAVSPADRLERERARLAELERERARVMAEIRALEAELAPPAAGSADAEANAAPESAVPSIETAEGRVTLFASLFRGRSDVFARRWTARDGRSGWSPQCANEWVGGICEKPRIKCSACQYRRLEPLAHEQVRLHLEGRHTIGVYPLLTDETCRLVAIDLDGRSWREDARVVREAADQHAIPVLDRAVALRRGRAPLDPLLRASLVAGRADAGVVAADGGDAVPPDAADLV
jgi:hypothetical protein